MSMLRQDPLTGRWIILAVGRSERPNEFPTVVRETDPQTVCPFCPGHEDQTTPEVLATGRPDGAAANSTDWRMRVFPNMYPALLPQNPKREFGVQDDMPAALFGHAKSLGHHEVVVYSADHMASPALLSAEHLAELLIILRDRSREFARHPDVRYVSAFCNHGPEAGATLAHPHMQIIAAPEIPLLAAVKARRCTDYHETHGQCLLCDLQEAERKAKDRLIHVSDQWTAFAPWASRFPWEMLFVPRHHQASMNQASDEELAALAELMAPALKGLFRFHGDPSLNLVIHSATVDTAGVAQGGDSFHWHLEVLPRLSRPAGFEVGTGYTINSVVPEVAAEWLRREWDSS